MNAIIESEEKPYTKYNQLIQNTTPIVPILRPFYVRLKDKTKKLKVGVIYFDPNTHNIEKLYGERFAKTLLKGFENFQYGAESHILAGIVRPSLPQQEERWSGDTIETLERATYSIHKGILKILNKRDGLPFVSTNNQEAVGDIIPAIRLALQGKNHTTIQKEIRRHHKLQQRIETIVGCNPFENTCEIPQNKPIKTSSTAKCCLLSSQHQGLSDKQIARLERDGLL